MFCEVQPPGIVAPSRRPAIILMRHGFSLANAERIVVSKMENGVLDQYGLDDRGRTQVLESSAKLVEALQPQEATLVRIISSPFSRAKQTADILADVLRGAHVFREVQLVEDDRLRERFFGELELKSDEAYQKVWDEDAAVGDSSTAFGSEATISVWNRVHSLIEEQLLQLLSLTRQHSILILVSHGDTLQITQSGLSGVPVHRHRSMPHMNQGEWRIVSRSLS
jgi:broad specificity phosphatase PhoE